MAPKGPGVSASCTSKSIAQCGDIRAHFNRPLAGSMAGASKRSSRMAVRSSLRRTKLQTTGRPSCFMSAVAAFRSHSIAQWLTRSAQPGKTTLSGAGRENIQHGTYTGMMPHKPRANTLSGKPRCHMRYSSICTRPASPAKARMKGTSPGICNTAVCTVPDKHLAKHHKTDAETTRR